MAIKFGAHLSSAGGYKNSAMGALELGCETFQMFSSNPRRILAEKEMNSEDVSKFKSIVDENSLGPVVIHANYLINIASPDDDKYNMAMKSLEEEIMRADALNASFLVLHPGHAMSSNRDEALIRAAEALFNVCEKSQPNVTICLENMSGTGTELGSNFKELQDMIEYSKCDNHLGVCFDTCHAFASGYDLRDNHSVDLLFREIENTIGSSRIKVVHINDSTRDLGTKRDRHANIGKGMIGLDGLRLLVNRKELSSCPFILETPDKEEGSRIEDLRILRSLVEE